MNPRPKKTADARILVVDDEQDILDLLEYNLAQAGYSVDTALDGRIALEKADAEVPDLVVLDIMMPVLDGIETCRRIRASDKLAATRVIMLTALSDEDDHVRGLDVGADIYLAKPISVPVLLSQVRALLRAADSTKPPPDRIEVGGLVIDRDRFVVKVNDGDTTRDLSMPRKEFELLYFLASHPGRVFGRQQLLDFVWGRDVYVVDRTVDVHVRKIREKLGSEFIETVKGVGYRFANLIKES